MLFELALAAFLVTAPRLPPDVLIVVLDDVGWTSWNAAEIPHITRLQNEGLTFARAYSEPSCTATRFEIQFGRLGRRNPSGWISHPIHKQSQVDSDLGQVSLAHIAGARGYRTAHFGKWHLSSGVNYVHEIAPELHGYETARAWSHANLDIATPEGSGVPGDYFHWLRNDDGAEYVDTAYATTAVADAFIEWWRSHAGEKRFAHVALNAPHQPFHAPPAELLPSGYSVGSANWQMVLAMLEAADAEIGRMLSAVDLEQTLVFVLSDNGNAPEAVLPGENPKQVKSSVHEGGINVPLIVYSPHTAGGTTRRLVSMVDLQATIADVLRYGGPLGEDSVSFADELGFPCRDEPREFVYSESFYPNGDPADLVMHTWAVSDGTHKLAVLEAPPGVEKSRVLFELQGVFPRVEVPILGTAAIEAKLQAIADAQ